MPCPRPHPHHSAWVENPRIDQTLLITGARGAGVTSPLGYDGQTFEPRVRVIGSRVDTRVSWEPNPGDPTTRKCTRAHHDPNTGALVEGFNCSECTVRSFLVEAVGMAERDSRVGLLAARLIDSRRPVLNWAQRVNAVFDSHFDELELRTMAKSARAWVHERVQEHFEQPTSWHLSWLPNVAA